MKIDSLSVFFPAFNEEKNIEQTVKKALEVLKKLAIDKFEVMVLDDGSQDQTRHIVTELTKNNPKIKLISHVTNKGYGAVIKSGFAHASYPWVAFTDSDGQFDFSEIEKFLPFTDWADFIIGYRLKRADPLIRSVGTFVWNLTARLLFGLSARDYSCGFKLIKLEAFNKVLPLEAQEKVTQIEMLVKAKKSGFKIYEVGVHHYPRKFGTPTGANLKVVIKSYVDLLKLWWKLK